MSAPTARGPVGQDRPGATGPPHGAAASAVTGLGVVAPIGVGVPRYWAAACAGVCGLATISRFDPSSYSTRVAGQVDLDPADHLPARLLPQTDHMTRLSLVAAAEALDDANVDVAGLPEFGAGVVTAASGGGFEFGQRELQALWSKGADHVSAYQSFAWFYPVNTGQISIRHHLRGTGGTLGAEQAGGLDAVAQAGRCLRRGAALMLAGGVDGSLCPWGLVCQIRSGVLSDRTDPHRCYLPFDAEACGQVPGEGGAVLVLEDPGGAAARGRVPYGEIVGCASTFDPRPGSSRKPGLRRAVEIALDVAGIDARGIDVGFADAARRPDADAEEARVLASLFGPRGVPVTAPKTAVGRLLGGGAALDLATALLSLRDQVIPPTIHIGRFSYGRTVDLVRDRSRDAALSTALVVARGHGGFNSAVVVRRRPPSPSDAPEPSGER